MDSWHLQLKHHRGKALNSNSRTQALTQLSRSDIRSTKSLVSKDTLIRETSGRRSCALVQLPRNSMLLEVNVCGSNTAEGAVRALIVVKWTSDFQVRAEGQPIRFVYCTFITGLQRFEIRGEASADLRWKDEMNTRKDDGPAATDGDDEMWGNVKNISFDLTNDEVNVINTANSKFLFADKRIFRKYTRHPPAQQGICRVLLLNTRLLPGPEANFRMLRICSLHQVLSQSCWIYLVMECEADNVSLKSQLFPPNKH